MIQAMDRRSTNSSALPGLPKGTVSTSTVLVISPRVELRHALARELQSLRWSVQEAESGAEAWLRQEERAAGAVLLSWRLSPPQ